MADTLDSRPANLERHLAADTPFADWRDIVNRVLTYVHRGMESLAERLPAARNCLTALRSASDERRYRVLGDPAVRDSVNEALAWVKAPSAVPPFAAERILEAASAFLSED